MGSFVCINQPKVMNSMADRIIVRPLLIRNPAINIPVANRMKKKNKR